MAKKIKFPLEMEDGVQVRSIEELKANFSLARLLIYIYNGKLVTWLKDRNAQSIADEIEALNTEAPKFLEKVCSIFDVNYSDIEVEQAQEINRKLNIFKKNNIEAKYIDVIDSIAFDQIDIYNLINNNKTKIYLYGDKFLIPLTKISITYIGINNPTITFSEEEKRKYAEKGITFIDVTEEFDITKIKDIRQFIIGKLLSYGVTEEMLDKEVKEGKEFTTLRSGIEKINTLFNKKNIDDIKDDYFITQLLYIINSEKKFNSCMYDYTSTFNTLFELLSVILFYFKCK